MSNFIVLHPDHVIVEDRFREDYGDLEELSASIKEHGQIQPISITPDYRLLAGGRRLAAIRLAGIESVDCVIHESASSDISKKEIELIENIHRKDLTWLERVRLEKAIFDLKGTQRGVAEVTDRSVGAVNRSMQLARAIEVIPALAKEKTADDAWKKLKKIEEGIVVAELAKRARAEVKDNLSQKDPKTSAFTWADNHYKIGDCITGLREANELCAGFAEVDPPYAIKLDDIKREAHDSISSYNEVDEDAYPEFLLSVAKETHRVLWHDAFCIWWFGPSHYTLVYETLCTVFPSVNPIPGIWYKGNQGQTQQPDYNLANCYEMFFVARKGQPRLKSPGRSNVFHYSPVPAQSKWHPTQRPPELIDDILNTFVWPGQNVVVPFLGSGQTLLSAYKIGVSGFGFDLSEEYKNRFLLEAQALGEK